MKQQDNKIDHSEADKTKPEEYQSKKNTIKKINAELMPDEEKFDNVEKNKDKPSTEIDNADKTKEAFQKKELPNLEDENELDEDKKDEPKKENNKGDLSKENADVNPSTKD
jgi:hypothetical protein